MIQHYVVGLDPLKRYDVFYNDGLFLSNVAPVHRELRFTVPTLGGVRVTVHGETSSVYETPPTFPPPSRSRLGWLRSLLRWLRRVFG